MKVLKSWLNDWIDISEISNEDISEGLESLGFEIEEQYFLKPYNSNIIVGKVIEINPQHIHEASKIDGMTPSGLMLLISKINSYKKTA